MMKTMILGATLAQMIIVVVEQVVRHTSISNRRHLYFYVNFGKCGRISTIFLTFALSDKLGKRQYICCYTTKRHWRHPLTSGVHDSKRVHLLWADFLK